MLKGEAPPSPFNISQGGEGTDWLRTKRLLPLTSRLNPSSAKFFLSLLQPDHPPAELNFWGAINLAFYFPLNIETFCSGPDLYFAKPGGCEHLKTIYWWNLLLLSGIARHYFKTLSSMFSCKNTLSSPDKLRILPEVLERILHKKERQLQ